MIYPVGSQPCKLDAKGRLLLPSTFKEQLGEAINGGFVMRKALFEPCIDVFGMDDWRKIQERLGKMNTFKKEAQIIQRKVNAGARIVNVDGSSRLQIPKDLLDKCNMVKDVVIFSLSDRMQIWSAEQLDKSDGEISDDEFQAMYEENLGSMNFNV